MQTGIEAQIISLVAVLNQSGPEYRLVEGHIETRAYQPNISTGMRVWKFDVVISYIQSKVELWLQTQASEGFNGIAVSIEKATNRRFYAIGKNLSPVGSKFCSKAGKMIALVCWQCYCIVFSGRFKLICQENVLIRDASVDCIKLLNSAPQPKLVSRSVF